MFTADLYRQHNITEQYYRRKARYGGMDSGGARRLKQVLMVAPEPTTEAALLSRMIDQEVRAQRDGSLTVHSGSDRADFVFLTKQQLIQRYPDVPVTILPERGSAGLVVAADLPVAEKALGASGIRNGGAICVPPTASNGALLVFVDA